MSSRESWVRTADVARSLRCSPRWVYKLEADGRLPRAERVAGQRRWRWEDLIPYVEAHRRSQPRGQSTRGHHELARRVRLDRSILARAFLACWERAGLATALVVLRRHGAEEGLRGLGVEQLARATAELQATTRLVRGVW